MIAKQHNHDGRLILAICDEDLINKKLEEGVFYLDLSSGFFKGEIIDKEKVLMLIKKAYIINAVGKKTISVLLKEGILEESGVLFISKIPYCQIIFEGRR